MEADVRSMVSAINACVQAILLVGSVQKTSVSFMFHVFLLCFIVQSTKEPNVVYLIEG